MMESKYSAITSSITRHSPKLSPTLLIPLRSFVKVGFSKPNSYALKVVGCEPAASRLKTLPKSTNPKLIITLRLFLFGLHVFQNRPTTTFPELATKSPFSPYVPLNTSSLSVEIPSGEGFF
jgi:hypothetical protein